MAFGITIGGVVGVISIAGYLLWPSGTLKEEEARFIKNLSNVEGAEMDSVKLICEVYKPSADVRWFKGDKELPEGGRYDQMVDGKRRILLIQNLKMDDAGEYTCRLSPDIITSAILKINEPEPKPSPLLSEPWRKMPWGDKERDLQYVQNYTPINKRVKHVRVLLYGPVGSGKSSFINSVSSTIRGRITQPAAPSSTTSDQSFTTTYQTHTIRIGTSDSFCQFVFNDIMGLEEGMERGVRAEDVKLAMMGHVKDGYKFNPRSPLSTDDPKYKPSPSADDQVHVVVCVLSANAPEVKVLEKMKVIREAARDLGIPQMAIITHIDEACEETEKDLRNVYKSKHLKNKMKDFSAVVGIPMNYIFPVKNYSEENDIVDDVDSLILSALRRMIDFGDDFIGNMDFSHHQQDDWMDWFLWFVYRILMTLALGIILIWIWMRWY